MLKERWLKEHLIPLCVSYVSQAFRVKARGEPRLDADGTRTKTCCFHLEQEKLTGYKNQDNKQEEAKEAESTTPGLSFQENVQSVHHTIGSRNDPNSNSSSLVNTSKQNIRKKLNAQNFSED